MKARARPMQGIRLGLFWAPLIWPANSASQSGRGHMTDLAMYETSTVAWSSCPQTPLKPRIHDPCAVDHWRGTYCSSKFTCIHYTC